MPEKIGKWRVTAMQNAEKKGKVEIDAMR